MHWANGLKTSYTDQKGTPGPKGGFPNWKFWGEKKEEKNFIITLPKKKGKRVNRGEDKTYFLWAKGGRNSSGLCRVSSEDNQASTIGL